VRDSLYHGMGLWPIQPLSSLSPLCDQLQHERNNGGYQSISD